MMLASKLYMIAVTGVTLNVSVKKQYRSFQQNLQRGWNILKGCSEDFAVVDGNEVTPASGG